MEFSIYPFDRYGKMRLYVRFFDQYDNEITRSTGITYSYNASNSEREAAKKKAEEHGKEIVIEYFDANETAYEQTGKNPRLSKFLKDEYWPYVESNCAACTLDRKKNNLKHFMSICKDRPMEAFRRLDIEHYKQQRLKQVKKITINIEIRSIKAAFNWAYKYEFIDRNPYIGQDFMFDVKSKKRAFTQQEINKLLEITEGKNIGLVIRLTYYTGMRLGEISGLTWNLVHLGDNPFLHIPSHLSKSGKARDIPLGQKALKIVEALQEKLNSKKQRLPKVYKNRSTEETYLLQKERGWGMYSKKGIQDKFRKAMNNAGLPKELTFHCLRHSFATHILEKNGNLYAVSKLMGHSSTQITQQFYDHTNGLNFRETADMI
jgi:site-specific recombinase XerD